MTDIKGRKQTMTPEEEEALQTALQTAHENTKKHVTEFIQGAKSIRNLGSVEKRRETMANIMRHEEPRYKKRTWKTLWLKKV